MKKTISIIIVVILITITAFYLGTFFQRKPSSTVTPTATPITQVITSPSPQLVGNDKDEHGCIGSAGYSWCAEKQKCIRVFEEDCASELGIKTALAQKYNKSVDVVFIKINKETNTYAKGSVSFDTPNSEGGMFLAAKEGNHWVIVFDGNGAVDCNQIKAQYDFPPEMLSNMCD